jgi:hypothetical protein
VKECTHCNARLPSDKFYVRKETRNLGSWCKDCIRKSNRARFLANPERQKQAMRRFRYGLSEAEFDALKEEQGGLCAICRREPNGRRLQIDHDHATGRIRGLLCGPCNMGLGQFRDSQDVLTSAVTYLEHGFIGEPF